MTVVNHLLDQDTHSLFHAVAYGKHLVSGNLAKSNVTGADPTHTITVEQMLGRGEWDGCEGLWWNGLEIKADKYRFYPGGQIAAPLTKTYTADAGTDVFTSAAHGLSDGDGIFLKATAGTLPAVLYLDYMYFVRDTTTNTFKIALTPGGTAVNISSNGSGTLQFVTTDADQSFPKDSPHSGIAWIAAELAEGVGEFNTAATPPTGLAGIFRTSKCQDYDEDGNEVGSPVYSANPALQIADLIIRHAGRPKTRIDWPAWCAWRDFCDELIAYDYTTLGDLDGFGLQASYYNGVAFDTLIKTRVDPFVEFIQSSGSPAIGVNVDNFSAKYEGTIKPKFSETYTFYLTHTHGAKLFVNNLATPLIDQWATTGTQSATIALTADTHYDIRVEWKHTTGDAELRLEWYSPSEAKAVIPPAVLFPLTVNRPRYETHPFFAAPTRCDDAVRTILNLCNSTYQEVDGVLSFFCLEQLEASQFRLRNEDIVDGSVSVRPRDILSLRNTWQAKYRDIDSQYMDEPLDPISIERPELIDAAGRRIDGDTIEMFNSTRHQVYRVLDNTIKRAVDSKYEISLIGLPTAFKILPGDVGGVDVEFLDWTNKKCLVIAATDSSSETTADERPLLLQEWTGQTLTEPDLEDPTAPVLLTAVADDDSKITITWSASTDDVAVTGYEYRVDGGSWVDAGLVLTKQITGLTAATEYDFEVRAYDAAGNRSVASNLLSETTDSLELSSTPLVVSFPANAAVQFTQTGIGSPVWTLEGDGTLDQSGNYTAPATPGTARIRVHSSAWESGSYNPSYWGVDADDRARVLDDGGLYWQRISTNGYLNSVGDSLKVKVPVGMGYVVGLFGAGGLRFHIWNADRLDEILDEGTVLYTDTGINVSGKTLEFKKIAGNKFEYWVENSLVATSTDSTTEPMLLQISLPGALNTLVDVPYFSGAGVTGYTEYIADVTIT